MSGLLEKTRNLLQYLEENYSVLEQRTWSKLEEKFGTSDFDKIKEFGMRSNLLKNTVFGKGNEKVFACEITLQGLDLLEKYNKEKIKEKSDKKLVDATIITALAASVGVFVTMWSVILGSEPGLYKLPALIVMGLLMVLLLGILTEKIIDLLRN